MQEARFHNLIGLARTTCRNGAVLMPTQLNKVVEKTERVILRQNNRINIYHLLQKVHIRSCVHVCVTEREREHYHIFYCIPSHGNRA